MFIVSFFVVFCPLPPPRPSSLKEGTSRLTFCAVQRNRHHNALKRGRAVDRGLALHADEDEDREVIEMIAKSDLDDCGSGVLVVVLGVVWELFCTPSNLRFG